MTKESRTMFFEPIHEVYFEELGDLEQQIEEFIDTIEDLPERAYQCKKVYGPLPLSIADIFKKDPSLNRSPYLWGAEALASRIADEYLTGCYADSDIGQPMESEIFDKAVKDLSKAIAWWQDLNGKAILANPANPLTKHNLTLFCHLRSFCDVAKQKHFLYTPDYGSKVAIEYSASWLKKMFGKNS